MRTIVRFLIWGAGGHGRVVAELVNAGGHAAAVFADTAAEDMGRMSKLGIPILPEAELLEALRAGRLPAECEAVALGFGDNALRMRCLAALDGVTVPFLVHPTAWISPTAVLGRGTVVMPGAVVHTRARIGDGVIVNTRAVVEHDCVLADGVHAAPGSVLAGTVRVGERSWIGAGATVIENTTVGAGVMVGAGAAVVRPVPDAVTVVGVPARILPR